MSKRKFSIFLISFFIFLAGFSTTAYSKEKEYDDLTVLLIDPKEGFLGVEKASEKEEEPPKKLSFQVDLQSVIVTNPLNHELEFSQIEVGDRLTVYAEVAEGGSEKIVEIVDYDRFERE